MDDQTTRLHTYPNIFGLGFGLGDSWGNLDMRAVYIVSISQGSW